MSTCKRRSAASRAVTPARVSALLVERHQGHDRQARDVADGLDRIGELVEVVESLDDEEVGPAAIEDRGLLREELAPHPRRHLFSHRSDRAADEDVAAGHLTRVARELDARRVDSLQLVLEELAGEFRRFAEGVRLDQLGAGVDEAHAVARRRRERGCSLPGCAGAARRSRSARPCRRRTRLPGRARAGRGRDSRLPL